MYQFDVKYRVENYYEYYKFVLIKQRISRDLVFCVLFLAIAAYWLIDSSDSTQGYTLPIFAAVMGVMFPLINFIYYPLLKRQLPKKIDDINRTHILINFNDEEVIYENLTAKKEEVNEEKPVEEVKDEKPLEEVKDENQALETKEEVKEEEKEVKEEKKDENIFKLKYDNFMLVRELKGLFLFYLDRQTVVIIPKETSLFGDDYSEFKAFILSKINVKRIKFLK